MVLDDVSGASVLFLALAQSCSSYIAAFTDFVSALQNAGLAVSVIVGENGSMDDTRARLCAAAAAGAPISVVDTEIMANVDVRLRRMAIGRELLKDGCAGLPLPSDYVCVIDLDDTLEKLPTPAAFLAAIGKLSASPAVFAISATSKPRYYDLLALRCAEGDYSTLQARTDAARGNPLKFYRFMRTEVFPEQRRITQTTVTNCVSAFNGMCLYRWQEYVAASYIADDNSAVCEHVVLNRSIHARTGKWMLIDPELAVAAPREHIADTPFEFFALRAVKALRRLWSRLVRLRARFETTIRRRRRMLRP